MAIQITSPAGPSSVDVSAKNTPVIYHLDMVLSGTEYTLVVPIGTKSFKVLADKDIKLTVATTLGGTTTDDSYVFYPGFEWQDELLSGVSALTFYVSSSKASTKLKIFTWT